MKTTPICLTCTAFLSTFLTVYADERDTMGLTALLAREPGLDGTGLRIAQVEASISSTAEIYQPNPASASQPASKFTFYDSNNVYPVSGAYDSNKQSFHANQVADHLFDLNTGVATDVNEIYIFNAGNFINQIVTPRIDISAKVVNQSFVISKTEVTPSADQSYDNYADNLQTLFVNGINNGSSTPVTSPAASYNGIAVGREDLNHSQGLADNRSKPELTAPGSASSYATPYVAGSATILIEAALPPLEHGGVGTATAASDIRTIKALLLNGAVKDSAWTHTDTHPLDTRRGAGQLNVNLSHLQLQGGKHSPTSSADVTPSPTHTPSTSGTSLASPIGWNFATITNPFLQNRDRIDNYYFDIPASGPTGSPLFDATATLVWHRQNGNSGINNLDLILYNADTGAVVEQSISTVDNVEHIHTRDIPAGRYVLQVIKRNANRVSTSEDYALAFNLKIPAPDAPTTLTAAAQPNLEVDLVWTDNSTDELNFELQRSTLSGRGYNTIATLPADTITYTDTLPLPNTHYYYRVKATNSNGDSFYSNIAFITPLMSWRQDHFASSSNSGNAANTADPDHDGIDNLTEYALGTDPNSAAGTDGSSASPKASIVNDGGTDYLQITVSRLAIRPDLNYIIEVSGDLQPGWTETTEILQNTATTLRVRDTLPNSSNDKRFIRLKVTEK